MIIYQSCCSTYSTCSHWHQWSPTLGRAGTLGACIFPPWAHTPDAGALSSLLSPASHLTSIRSLLSWAHSSEIPLSRRATGWTIWFSRTFAYYANAGSPALWKTAWWSRPQQGAVAHPPPQCSSGSSCASEMTGRISRRSRWSGKPFLDPSRRTPTCAR